MVLERNELRDNERTKEPDTTDLVNTRTKELERENRQLREQIKTQSAELDRLKTYPTREHSVLQERNRLFTHEAARLQGENDSLNATVQALRDLAIRLQTDYNTLREEKRTLMDHANLVRETDSLQAPAPEPVHQAIQVGTIAMSPQELVQAFTMLYHEHEKCSALKKALDDGKGNLAALRKEMIGVKKERIKSAGIDRRNREKVSNEKT